MTQQPVQQIRLNSGANKNLAIAYTLWLVGFFGVLGLHQFYLGRPLRGVGYLFTCGWLGIMALFDLFSLPTQVRRINTLGY